MTNSKFMLDTFAYNALCEDPDVFKLIEGALMKEFEFNITHVQVDEIAEISDKNKETRRRASYSFLMIGPIS